MRKITRIVVHCAASTPGMNTSAADIRRWHVDENGWRDIGYHYVITRDGTLETGRPLEQAGAHVAGFNADSIGICLSGGLNDDHQPDANYTRHQFKTLENLLIHLSSKFPAADVCGHRDLDDGKSCPCFDVSEWWQGGNDA